MQPRPRSLFIFAINALLIVACHQGGEAQAGPTKKDITEARELFSEHLDKIEKEYLKSRSSLLDQYGQLLQEAEKEARNTGDLDILIAFRDESKRFRSTREPLREIPDAAPETLKKLQNNFLKALLRARKARNQKILSLVDTYKKRLESIQKTLVMDGQVDLALQVSQTIEEADSNARVSEAVFEEELLDPAPDPDKPTSTGEESTEPVEIITYEKELSFESTSLRNWTMTTVRVLDGDEVTVTASGAWNLPGGVGSCGPEGYSSPYYNYMARYAMDPAQPYGAVLLKCGQNGTIRKVGKHLHFKCEEGGTLLMLDGNLKQDYKLRSKCDGTMKITITVKRHKKR